MKYGYFDESKKEYVITRPDTPAQRYSKPRTTRSIIDSK